jgi:hypothetical protein
MTSRNPECKYRDDIPSAATERYGYLMRTGDTALIDIFYDNAFALLA